MAKDIDVTAGKWWRASRYELRDNLILPARGAALTTYDPWEGYVESRSARGTKDPAYGPLFTLLGRMECRPGTDGRRYFLPRESQELLLAWCADHGLLGLLPHRVQVVSLAPRWWRPESGVEIRGRDIPPKAVYPAWLRFVRTSSGWEAYRTIAWERMRKADERIRNDALVAARDLPANWRPRVVLRGLGGRDWGEEPLSVTWGRFFSLLRGEDVETRSYYRPGTLEFCREYGEPVDDFLDAAFTIKRVFDTLAFKERPIKVGDPEGDRLENARLILLALVDPVSQTLVDAGGRLFRQYWSSPSLLGSYASMMLQDLGDRRLRFVRCKRCEAVFPTYAYQADYCSGTCRRGAYKRRKIVRKKKEEKRIQARATKERGEGDGDGKAGS